MLTQQQVLDVMLDNKYISALTFKIPDPRALGAVKDALEKRAFGTKMTNDIRLCVVIEDAQFSETLSSIARRSKYLEILYPILLALVCILGLVTGFLAAYSRREDIALMRGLGTHKRRILPPYSANRYCCCYAAGCRLPLCGICAGAGSSLLQRRSMHFSSVMCSAQPCPLCCRMPGALYPSCQKKNKEAV